MKAPPAPSAPTRREHRRRLWWDRLTSIWIAPATFILASAGYTAQIELWPASVSWALPTVRALALLAVVYEAAVFGWRLAFRRAARLRRLRVEARGVIDEVHRELRRRPALDAAVRERLLASAGALDAAVVSDSSPELEAVLEATSTAADELLKIPAWRYHAALASGLLWALVVALVVRTVLVEPFRIPSGSMLPTLQVGDQVFVNRFVYGLRLPFTNRVPWVFVRRPQVGDVVVFQDPVTGRDDLIKRVAAVAGDTVELRDDVLVLNGVPQPRALLDARHVAMDRPHGRWVPQERQLWQETLGGVEHAVLQRERPQGGERTYGPWTVPEGHLFMLGDNRDGSADSRHGFGRSNRVEFVPYGNVKGKAMVIWLSLSHRGMLSGLFGGTGLRLDRFFLPVR